MFFRVLRVLGKVLRKAAGRVFRRKGEPDLLIGKTGGHESEKGEKPP
jgi:hypothetical protein